MDCLYPSHSLWLNGVWKHTVLHFSLKSNVYLNQIKNQRETSDLSGFAYKSCRLHSYAFPQGDTFVSSLSLTTKTRGKMHSCFEKQQVIASFQGIKPNKTPFFFCLLPSSENTYYSSPWSNLEMLLSHLLHPHFRILAGRPPRTSKCLFYKT